MLTSCQHIRRLGGKRCAQWTSSGRTTALLPVTISVARVLNPDDKDDWVNFYVNIFVDRDMLVRHFGHGVGHLKHHGNNDTSDSESEAMEMTPKSLSLRVVPWSTMMTVVMAMMRILKVAAAVTVKMMMVVMLVFSQCV